MKQLLNLLLYTTGFVQGMFATALKNFFNVEILQFIQKSEDNDPPYSIKVKYDEFVTHLHNTYNVNIAEIYMMLSFLKVIQNNQLVQFFKDGMQGNRTPNGWVNIIRISEAFDCHLLGENLYYKINTNALRSFIDNLNIIPSGIEKKLVTVPCTYCNNGYLKNDICCNVCKGIGKVEQWEILGNELTDERILSIQKELSKYAASVARILDDYIQYYIATELTDTINSNTATSNEFIYDAGSFTAAFNCNFRGGGKFPSKNIKVALKYKGFDFTFPVVVTNDSLIEEPKDRDPKNESNINFKSEEGCCDEDDWDINDTGSEMYLRKDGTKVIGYTKPDKNWSKFYHGEYNGKSLYFDGGRYSRDVARQAFASIMGASKYDISLTTVTPE